MPGHALATAGLGVWPGFELLGGPRLVPPLLPQAPKLICLGVLLRTRFVFVSEAIASLVPRSGFGHANLNDPILFRPPVQMIPL